MATGRKPGPGRSRARPLAGRGPRAAAARPRQRRALSMARAPGPTGWGGDPELGRALVEALVAAASDQITAESLTHPVHAYPARLHPATARHLVELVGDGVPPTGLVLDPFCGSGTTLVEACAAGRRAAGVDLNPLAVLLARAKTWLAPVARRRQARDLGRQIAGETLAMGRAARRAGQAPAPLRAPVGFDPNARQRRIGRWFSPHVRRELEAIAGAIDQVAADDQQAATVLQVALSAILYKVSHRQSDTDPTWVERSVARGAAARLFAERVEMIVSGLDDLARERAPIPQVIEADARALPALDLGPVAAIVTSPPYAGTYDYADHHRLRFDFLGLRHRALERGELGSRREFTRNSVVAAARWQGELSDALTAMATVLVPGGRAALVVGDSLTGTRARFADDDVRAALDRRLTPVAWAWQERLMLGGLERRAFADRPKREHVVLVERTRD